MIKIAHISDLHFGVPKQKEVWKSLRKYLKQTIKPHLVLVTGDIVDTPDKGTYQTARKKLDDLETSYLVCPGNHDRHPYGNALGGLKGTWDWIMGSDKAEAWFDKSFVGVIATPNTPHSLELKNKDELWRLGVIGVDTSAQAKYSAQGIASLEDLQLLESTAWKLTQHDLVIALQHHHLLPIMELELEQRQRLYGLLKPTIMLNAGTVLETLARANVSLVLHGHEHHRTVARYGTLREKQSGIVVVGAGSATGAKTADGCDLSRVSLNLFELRDDRSVWLQEVRHEGDQWARGLEVQLLDGKSIRRARFYRIRGLDRSPRSKIVKCMDYHANRDITITETWTDFRLDDRSYRKVTANSSGFLTNAQVQLRWKDGHPSRTEKSVPFLRHPSSDHTHWVDVPLVGEEPIDVDAITITFRWHGGAVLTTADLNWLPESRGQYRNEGFEYAAIDAVTDLESLSLLVRLPPEFAPEKREDITVFWQEIGGGKDKRHSSKELYSLLHFHAPGFFSLEVPYPIKNYEYALAWKPRVDESKPSNAALGFRRLVSSDGALATSILEAFRAVTSSGELQDSATYALSVPAPSDTGTLMKVGQVVPNALQGGKHPPSELRLHGGGGLHSYAWYGEIQRVIRETSDTAASTSRMGFVEDELGIAVVPIRRFGHENDVTWGIVRVGILGNTLINQKEIKSLLLKEALADGIAALIKEFHQENG